MNKSQMAGRINGTQMNMLVEPEMPKMPPHKPASSKVQQKFNPQPLNHLPTAPSPTLSPRASIQPVIPVPPAETEAEPSETFNQSQICFAITILRSKPPDVTTEDYINHLLKNYKREGSAPRGKGRCVDTVEYWKDEYSRMFKKKQALEAEVEHLRRLKNGSSDESIGFQSIVQNNDRSRKRKADVEQSQPQEDSEDDELAQRTPEGRPSVPISCFNVIKHAQILHNHLSNPAVPAKVLLSSLQTTIFHLSLSLESTAMEHHNYYPRAELQRSLQTAVAVYNICLKGLSHLCRDIPGRSLKGQVIYSLVKLFKSVLTASQDLCLTLAAAEAARLGEELPSTGPNSSVGGLRMKAPYLLTERTRFLAAILRSREFDTKQSSHLDVLKGTLAVFLKRVGELLSESVFGEVVAESALPGHISTVPSDAVPDPAHVLAVRLEAEQVKWLLARVTAVGESCREGGGGNEEGGPGARHLSELIKGRTTHPGVNADELLGIARRRLRDMLLKGLFGEDGSQYQLALKIPEWEGEEEEGVEVSDEGSDGFVGMVWEAVGWEMLADS